MKKILFSIILFMMFMPFYVNAEDLYSCDICTEKNIPEYYIDNLKIGQEFNTGDVIYRVTPVDKLSDEIDTICNLHIHCPSTAYGITYYFDEVTINLGGAYASAIVGYGFHLPNYSEVYNEVTFDKNVYWKLEKVEKLAQGEVAALYFQSYNRTINLNITNKVNNVDKYNAKKDEVISYSVNVKNTGDGYSENNIITTIIHKALEIDENRISDNGIYNKEKNTITWHLDEVGPNDEYTFNYYAKVVDENITEYIGNSYITSNQVQEKVISNDTVVSIENKINIPNIMKNPNTETGISVVIITIVILVSIITYIMLKRKKNYIMK